MPPGTAGFALPRVGALAFPPMVFGKLVLGPALFWTLCWFDFGGDVGLPWMDGKATLRDGDRLRAMIVIVAT